MVLYGFKALYIQLENKTLKDDLRFNKSDYDLLVTYEEFNELIKKIGNDAEIIMPKSKNSFIIKTKNGVYDIHIVKDNNKDSNLYLYENIENYSIKETFKDFYGNEFKVVNINTLYEIKKSHRMIEKFFFKTMKDIEYFKNILNDVPESEFYKLRLAETLVRAKNQTNHINLNQDKKNFFNTKGVTYIYDHDSIHFSIKLTNEPIYKKILVPGEDVLCSEELWNNLTELEKKQAVLEEAYTIAIERSLSKYDNVNPNKAFNIALSKICTTLCRGWFREYAYTNYHEIKNMYSNQFWITFQEDLKNNKILPFKKDTKNF